MNEKKKLEEASYFYSQMLDKQNNKEVFVYNLSAFLSSARSVLQYALKEASPKFGGQKWYESLIASSSVLKFLKDERDTNIHTEPTRPKAHYTIHAESGVYTLRPGSVSAIVSDKNGKTIQQVKSETVPDSQQEKPNNAEKSTPNKVRYVFDNWVGNEDVPTLCKKCIQELENAIKDGVAKGFITE